jgi:protein-tyrosine phosphatase
MRWRPRAKVAASNPRAGYSLEGMSWFRIVASSALLAACSSEPLPGLTRETNEPALPSPDPTECAPGTPIFASEIVNARDLGGVPVDGERRVACGALFRGPPLAALSSEGCAELERLGIRTVIDLRTVSERESRPDAPCVAAQAELVFAPLPIPYNLSPADYVADLNATDSMALAFQRIGSAGAFPIYFHCTWGRDRTGVMAAVILLALGAKRADILEEYQHSALSVGAYPESLAAVLDAIEKQGGLSTYLGSLGFTEDALETLRSTVLESAL